MKLEISQHQFDFSDFLVSDANKKTNDSLSESQQPSRIITLLADI